MPTLIKNCKIVTETNISHGDIFIENGIISKISENIFCDDLTVKVIDADWNYVVPGGIDVHTHLNLDVGIAVAKDDFFTGTVAAACGGTTTVVDHMGFGPAGCCLKHQVDVYHGYAEGKAVVDYSFHGVFQHVNENILSEVKSIINNEGIPSFKGYSTYTYKLSDSDFFKIMRVMKREGGLLTVHPENDSILNLLREEFVELGKLSPIYHERSRPTMCEAEAINRAICLSAMAGNSPLYIVHLSSNDGLDFIRLAKNSGRTVMAETCPQYLFLDDSMYEREDGLKYILSPPLRNIRHQDLLWKGIKDGVISTVATDHCPFDYSTRLEMASNNFTKCPNGLPGIELRIPLIFSEGVSKGRIDLSTFVKVTSTNPAKIMGMYPRKGTISVGSDADIVIIDPNKKVYVSHNILHENVDYTPYEGMELIGYPILTMLRGEVIAREGMFVGKKGYGKFIKRYPFNYPNIM